MTIWHGWGGTILDVDLTTGTISKLPLEREMALDHLGGLGFGTKRLYSEVGPQTEPLGPENIVSIGNGPLCGTLAPASGRIDVVAKSPITGIFARSNAGGMWGSELKWAGYDQIVLRGQSERPVFLWIDDDKAELRDASDLWGLDTWSTEHALRRQLRDPEVKTLRIGPAGENQSLGSAIIVDLGRAAATRGLAAILGAKKLKAIAVRGRKGVSLAYPKEVVALFKDLAARFRQDPMYASHTKYGTNTWVGDTVFRSVAKAMGTEPPVGLMSESFSLLYEKNLSCASCPLHCSHFYNIKDGRYAGTLGEGVEGNCQLIGEAVHVFEADFICAYNNECNKLGLDVMHTGNAIGWAMRLFKEGIINRADTDGVELTPGNESAVFHMMNKMARNEGFGQLLNLGPSLAAPQIGRGADMYVSHCKKYPSAGAGFMSSVKTTLAHNVATRGFDHLTGSPGIETPNRQPEMSNEVFERVGLQRYGDASFFTDSPWGYRPKYAQRVYEVENLFALSDMLGTCKFAAQEVLYVEGIGVEDYARLLRVVTGVDFDAQSLIRAAEREMLLERAFNAREGIRRRDDYPHAFQWELEHGECHPQYNRARYRLSLEDYGLLLDEYYRLRGCDLATGIPDRPKLQSLGLDYVADDLERRGVGAG